MRRAVRHSFSHMHAVSAFASHPVVEAPLRIDALRVSLMVILLLSIGRMQESLPILGAVRAGLVCTAVALAYALTQPQSLAAGGLLRTWPAKIVVGLAVLACIGAPFGLSLGASVSNLLSRFSRVLVFILLLMVAIRGVRDLRWFVWGYVVAAGYLCYLALFVVEVTHYTGSEVARLDGDALGAYDANDIGVILMTALPFAMLTLQCSRWKGTIVSVLVLVGISATIAISGSRGGFLGIIAVAAALLVYLSHISVAKRLGAVVLVAASLALAAKPGYWAQMRTIIEPDADYNRTAEDGRLEVWKRGFGYMVQYPVFGVGFANFSRAEGTISVKARNHVAGTGIRYTAAHNSFVQVGAELGFVGLALWSSLVIGGIVGMGRLRRRLPRSWLQGDPDQRFLYLITVYLPVAFIGFAVTGSFVSFAYSAPVYILAAFVTGTYVAVDRRISAELALSGWSGGAAGTRPPPPPRWSRGLRNR